MPSFRHRRGEVRGGKHAMLAIRQQSQGLRKLLEWLHPDDLVRVVEQTINPDYPKTTPRGGTGKGVWIR